jgi:hypothetical protein
VALASHALADQAGLAPADQLATGGAASSDDGGAKPRYHGAVLVVGGFGSSCCHSADALQAAEPGMLVRQFSFLGLNAGQPIPYGPDGGDLSIQVLGGHALPVRHAGAAPWSPRRFAGAAQARPWLAVVPLADAVTLPACSWPQNVVFVDALHGGLLGDAPAGR